MKTLISTVLNVQDQPDDRWHATIAGEVPVNVGRIELPEDICDYLDASGVSDIHPGTYSFGLSGSGKCSFSIGQEIRVTAYEIGELPQ
jgi:hypothetical protein